MTDHTPTAITYRPKIAAALEKAGIRCRRVPNVFDRSKSGWEYPDTPEARKIVTAATAAAKAEKARAGK